MKIHRSGGFSLLEVFISLTLLAIVTTASIGMSGQSITRANADSCTQQLNQAIQLARSIAINGQHGAANITLCGLNAAQNGCSTASNWTNGYMLFADDRASVGFGAGDTLLVNQPNTCSSLSVNQTNTGVSLITFSTRGNLTGTVAGTTGSGGGNDDPSGGGNDGPSGGGNDGPSSSGTGVTTTPATSSINPSDPITFSFLNPADGEPLSIYPYGG